MLAKSRELSKTGTCSSTGSRQVRVDRRKGENSVFHFSPVNPKLYVREKQDKAAA